MLFFISPGQAFNEIQFTGGDSTASSRLMSSSIPQNWWTQSFYTTSTTTNISSIDVRIFNQGSGATLGICLDDSPLLDRANFSDCLHGENFVIPGYGLINFRFDNSAPVSTSTLYYVSLLNMSTTTNININYGSNLYSGNQAAVASGVLTNYSTSDFAIKFYTDLDFNTYFCGDGDINPGEVCDDGENNGEIGYCDETCSGQTEYCGDSIINQDEVCDDGENNGELGYCNETCTGEKVTIDFYPCEIPENFLIQRKTGCENIYRTSTTTADEVRFYYEDYPLIMYIFVYSLGLLTLYVFYLYIIMKKRR